MTEAGLPSLPQAWSFFFDHTPDLLCVADTDGYFRLINPAWERVLGYNVEELRSHPFLHFVHPEDKEKTEREARRVALDDSTRLFENRYVHKDGRTVWLNWNSVHDPSTGLIYAMARDVTERVEAERGRARMFHNIAHDMAAPISAVHHVATSYGPDEVGPEHWDLLQRSGERLMGLLEDVRDVGRISERGLELDFARVDLQGLVQDAVADLRHYAQERGVDVDVRGGRCVVEGDAARLARVVTNLLHNAIKFSPAGSRVLVEAWQEDDNGHVVVVDAGPGIAPQDIPRLFQPFCQLDHAPGRGTGLGLFICKSIVEAHGGAISVVSGPSGSRFTFSLPLKARHLLAA